MLVKEDPVCWRYCHCGLMFKRGHHLNFYLADKTVQQSTWDNITEDESDMEYTRKLDKQMMSLIKEFAHQVVFCIIVLVLCYSNQDNSVYLQNEAQRNRFAGHSYRVRKPMC